MTATIICIDCGDRLTEEERHYYECRCEECTQGLHSRIEAWRRGAPDAELDRLYEAVPMQTH